jgi:4-carboxymuconolactone decarboxylase
MARIEGVSQAQAGPVVKLVYRFGPGMMKKMTGRDPRTGNGIEPIEIWAHQPRMLVGMGRFNQAVRKGKSVDERIRNLVELKGAQMIGCEYCVDLGSQICRNSGFSDAELLALPRYQSSDLFTDREKAALDYTVAVMRTPVEVTDELFARVHSYFDDRQLVEITALLTLVNLDRFNAAFGIGAAGFSDGMVCVPPDRPQALPSRLPLHRPEGCRAGLQLAQGRVRDLGERGQVLRRRPAGVSGAEGEHAHLGSQARGHLVGAACTQRFGHGRAEPGPLEQLAFLQLTMGRDHRSPLRGQIVAVRGERDGGGVQRRGEAIGGCRRGRSRRDRIAEQLNQHVLAAEQYLPLVGEVPEERALGQPGAVRDLGHGRGVEAVLGEQGERGAFEAFPRVRFPAGHGDSLRDDTESHHLL